MKRLAGLALLASGLAWSQGNGQEVPLGIYNTSAPTLTNGNYNPLRVDVNGNLLVNVAAGSSSNACASATGSAVPASSCYDGVNVAGTLRGLTGVNPSGSIFAAQIDIASAAGTTLSVNNGTADAGTVRVAIASNNTAFTVNAAQSGTWTVQPGNTPNTVPWLVRNKTTCGGTYYESLMQYLPSTSTQLTATATCINYAGFSNKDTANHTINLQDQSTGCNSGICATFTSFTLAPGGYVDRNFGGTEFIGGIKWNADAANVVVGNIIGWQ